MTVTRFGCASSMPNTRTSSLVRPGVPSAILMRFPTLWSLKDRPGPWGARQPMIRYTQPLNNAHSMGVSVEKSGTDTPFSTQYGVPAGSSHRPDLVGFYRYENPHGHLYFAG